MATPIEVRLTETPVVARLGLDKMLRPTEDDIMATLAEWHKAFLARGLNNWRRLVQGNWTRLSTRLRKLTAADPISQQPVFLNERDDAGEAGARMVRAAGETPRPASELTQSAFDSLCDAEATGAELGLDGISEEAAFGHFVSGVQNIWLTLDRADMYILLTICRLFFPRRLAHAAGEHRPAAPHKLGTLTYRSLETSSDDTTEAQTIQLFMMYLQTGIMLARPDFLMTHWLDCRAPIWRVDMLARLINITLDNDIDNPRIDTTIVRPSARLTTWNDAMGVSMEPKVDVRLNYSHEITSESWTDRLLFPVVCLAMNLLMTWRRGHVWSVAPPTQQDIDEVEGLVLDVLERGVIVSIATYLSELFSGIVRRLTRPWRRSPTSHSS